MATAEGGGAEREEAARLAELAYRTILGRPINDIEIEMRISQLCSGVPFTDMFIEIATSGEASARVEETSRTVSAPEQARPGLARGEQTALWRVIILGTYERLLRRTPGEVEMEHWLDCLAGGLSVDDFLQAVMDAVEAAKVRAESTIGSGQSDGEFLVTAGQLLFGRGLTPQEVTHWQGVLDEVPERRTGFVRDVLNAHIRERLSGVPDGPLHDGSSCQVMGTTQLLTQAVWAERRAEAGRPAAAAAAAPAAAFAHTGTYAVSMIASLYKGGRYIRHFLDNVTSQTLFHSAELVIIDADSPDGERAVIEAYAERFPNIVYKRMDYRIGIYDAWNVAIGMARGRYLTNTNLDDVRRADSIELQAAMLDEYDDVDVVYQDFYYSLEANLSFEEVAAAGFKTELPVLTRHNFLMFNSPHNAPMWRARLHPEVGLFDTQYRSAGDYEFWARCLVAGKRFRKINTPHAAYYQNPKGISTRPDTPGIREARGMSLMYASRLISPSLLQSRQDVAASLGLDAAAVGPGRTSYYDLAQTALLRLGRARDPAAP